MNKLTLNSQEIPRWFSDNGDNTHNVNYDLTENSIVMDVGAYTGIWIDEIIKRYNPYVYLLEPVKEFYDILVEKFKNNSKVKVMMVAVASSNRIGTIYLNKDGSSSNTTSNTALYVEYKTIDSILKEWSIGMIDLVQINIEGDEYPLLDYMIQNNLLNHFTNIQVQFHMGVGDEVNKRNFIQQQLIKGGFTNKFDYPFVWESWTKYIK